MNLKTLREYFFSVVKDLKTETDAPIADRYLNSAYIEIYESFRWEQRKRDANLLLIPKYTNGSCAVTAYDGSNEAAAKTVTFSGANLVSNMVGRSLKVGDSKFWHKIVAISGDVAYLDTPIVDASGGNNAFIIWNRIHYLLSDVDVLLAMDQFSSGKLEFFSNNKLRDSVNDDSRSGNPYAYSPYGIDPYDDVSYETGMVSMAVDSNVITGTGTSWLSSGLGVGDVVEINSVSFYIKRIESDTRIVSFNHLSGTQISDSVYVGKKNNPVGFKFYGNADAYKIINYSYFAHAYPLVHETKDFMLFPPRAIPAIASRAIFFRMRDTSDPRMTTQLQIYTAELNSLKSQSPIIKPPYEQFSPKIPSFMPGRS